MVTIAPFRLPGQTRYASVRLKTAVAAVEKRSGKPVVFKDIRLNPEIGYASLVQGQHDDQGDAWRIWVDALLPFTAQEAVVAHEIAHILEHLFQFPVVRSVSRKTDFSLLPALNNLVLDDHADRWAIRHGFRIDAALKKSKLSEIQARLAAAPSDIGTTMKPLEVKQMALNYAGLKVRLERFGLFGKIDESWSRKWPASRALGIELAETVARWRCEDATCCRELILDLAHKLGIDIRW